MMMRKVAKNWSVAPDVKFARANFNLSHRVLTSLNPGVLVPLEYEECIPGDSMNDASTHLVRVSSSFAKPFVGDVYLDTYKFFVPLRLVMKDLEKVFGQSGLTQWQRSEGQQTSIPVTLETSTVTKGSVADYLGLPVGATIPEGISVLPFRAFALIWNEWFRNQNVYDDVNIADSSTRQSYEKINANAWSSSNYFGMLPPVNRYKDYFTSCLLAPQKGVEFFLDGSQVDPKFVEFMEGTGLAPVYRGSPSWVYANGGTASFNDDASVVLAGDGSPGSGYSFGDSTMGATADAKLSITNATYHIPSVNEARLAFSMQKYLEADALGGSRYREYILSHYGVDNGDARMQIPEFLAGAHNRINVQQVAATAQTEISGETFPVGSLAGYSQTIGNKKAHYVKSVTEHGYIFTVVCVRQKHDYSQGIHRKWTRKVRTDFYDPKFAFLGFQPVYKSEIYGFVGSLKGDVLGYQEPYGELRCGINQVTAGMRPTGSGSLGDTWSIADRFTGTPNLLSISDETAANLTRVVTVDPSQEDMFIVDTWFDRYAVRIVPAYATPGLVDHH